METPQVDWASWTRCSGKPSARTAQPGSDPSLPLEAKAKNAVERKKRRVGSRVQRKGDEQVKITKREQGKTFLCHSSLLHFLTLQEIILARPANDSTRRGPLKDMREPKTKKGRNGQYIHEEGSMIACARCPEGRISFLLNVCPRGGAKDHVCNVSLSLTRVGQLQRTSSLNCR